MVTNGMSKFHFKSSRGDYYCDSLPAVDSTIHVDNKPFRVLQFNQPGEVEVGDKDKNTLLNLCSSPLSFTTNDFQPCDDDNFFGCEFQFRWYLIPDDDKHMADLIWQSFIKYRSWLVVAAW